MNECLMEAFIHPIALPILCRSLSEVPALPPWVTSRLFQVCATAGMTAGMDDFHLYLFPTRHEKPPQGQETEKKMAGR